MQKTGLQWKNGLCWKKPQQNKSTEVILIWCLKQVKDFIFKFSIKGSSVEVHKIINFFLQNTFFTSSGYIDEMLVRLPLIKQIINHANSMCISFSVEHTQKFRES